MDVPQRHSQRIYEYSLHRREDFKQISPHMERLTPVVGQRYETSLVRCTPRPFSLGKHLGPCESLAPEFNGAKNDWYKTNALANGSSTLRVKETMRCGRDTEMVEPYDFLPTSSLQL